MVNSDFFTEVKRCAESSNFLEVTSLTEAQTEKQRHIEMAVRFLVHVDVPYDGKLDVGEYIDEGIVLLATEGRVERARYLLEGTFDLLKRSTGSHGLKRYEPIRGYSGRVGLVGLEGIAVGIGRNLDAILGLPDPVAFVRQRSQDFWMQPEVNQFVSPGMRGTTRIEKTVPFGERWFAP